MQPGMCTFDDPTDFPEAATVRVTAPRDAGGDVARVKDASVLVMIVTTIGVDTPRTTQRPAPHAANRYDGLDQWSQLGDVVTIGAGQDCRDRRAVGVGGNVVFGNGSRSIGGVRASFSPAPTARIDDESTTTREKSIFSAALSFASSIACSRSHTPACCQSRRLRQQLTPEPHPISAGRSRHRMPVFSTNKMPVSAARSGTGLRPGYLKRRGFSGGSSGSISAHSSSSMIGLPISSILLLLRSRLILIYGHPRFCNAEFCGVFGLRKSIRRQVEMSRRASMRIAPGGPYNRGSFRSWLTSQGFRQAGLPFTSSVFSSRKTRWVDFGKTERQVVAHPVTSSVHGSNTAS